MGNNKFYESDLVSEGFNEIDISYAKDTAGKEKIDYSRIKIHPLVVDKIYDIILSNSKSESGLDFSAFRITFEEIGKMNKTLQKYIINIISNDEKQLSFQKYMEMLSVSSQGTTEEKAQLVCKMLDYNNNEKVTLKELEDFVESICTINKESKSRKKEMISCAKQLFDKNMDDDDIVPVGDSLGANQQDLIPILQEEEEEYKIKVKSEFNGLVKSIDGPIDDEYEFSDTDEEEEENKIEEETNFKKKSYFIEFDEKAKKRTSQNNQKLQLLLEKKNLLKSKFTKSRYSILSIDELKMRGKKNADFLNSFGFFNILNQIVENILDMVGDVFNDSNIQYINEKPSISGILTSGKTGNKRIALVQDGFLSFYQGKEMENNFKKLEPSRVLNLQEVQVKRYYDSSLFSTNYSFSITINKPYYYQTFYVKDEEEVNLWIWCIQKNSPMNRFRFNSSFPIQQNCGTNYFIGGGDYFTHLVKNLKNAKEQIFITGWRISPHYLLSRNEYGDGLDEVLLERAKSGVKIYVLVWADPRIDGLTNLRSDYVEDTLNSLHSNIKCIKDPTGTLFSFWSHHQKMVVIDQNISYLGGIDICYNRWENSKKFPLFDVNSTYFPGMDYVNPMIRSKPVGNNLEDYFDRQNEHRLPWQDIQALIVGNIARDVSKNFIQRWNLAIRLTKLKPLIPKCDKIPKEVFELSPYKNCNVQLLRSAAKWSFGLDTPEKSIYECYLDLIENSEHFIYIENQYFISSPSDNQVNPQNRIAAALLRRLRKAIIKKETFKIVLILPLQNAAPLTTGTFDQTKIIVYWQFLSIFRGKDSLFEILNQEFPNIDLNEYIYIGSLRAFDFRPKTGKPITEMIYVHSKVMIVDDKFALIGSANINDRSLHGNRDTEIACLIEDEDKIEIKMNGKKYLANKFAHEMRMNLYQYYLGRENFNGLEDPILFDDELRKISNSNSKIFKNVFVKIHDTVEDESELHYLTDYQKYLEPKNVHQLKNIEGFLIDYPRNFLIKSSSDAKISEAIDKLFI
eukprot:gene5093-8692_t